MKLSNSDFSNIEYHPPQPQVIDSEYITLWDVDDTLVMHTHVNQIPYGDKVEVQDPVGDRVIPMQVNRPMIRLLEEEHARGAHIIVWSRGGYKWTLNVIKALGLTDKVHQVMSKPMAYFDDKPIGEWLTYRVYLKPDTVYKTANKE